jgi:hypothetical protein
MINCLNPSIHLSEIHFKSEDDASKAYRKIKHGLKVKGAAIRFKLPTAPPAE